MNDSPPITSVGNVLKETRSKKSISLEDVYAKTKIHPQVLTFLENDEFEKLPSPLFAKSFLKSYAEFLELNVAQVVQAYEQSGKKKEPEQVLFIRPAEERPRQAVRAVKMLPAFGLVAAIALGGLGLFYLIRSADGLFRKPSGFVSSSGKGFQSSAGEMRTKTSGWVRNVHLGNFPRLDPREPLELKIKASDNVWLKVTCDGKVLFQSILKPRAAESWKAQKQIEIWTGNSLNMTLSLNGHSLGSVGKGVIKKMIITHEGVKIGS